MFYDEPAAFAPRRYHHPYAPAAYPASASGSSSGSRTPPSPSPRPPSHHRAHTYPAVVSAQDGIRRARTLGPVFLKPDPDFGERRRAPTSHVRLSARSPRAPTPPASPADADFAMHLDPPLPLPSPPPPPAPVYGRVLDAHIAEMAAANEETVRWVRAQQAAREAARPPFAAPHPHPHPHPHAPGRVPYVPPPPPSPRRHQHHPHHFALPRPSVHTHAAMLRLFAVHAHAAEAHASSLPGSPTVERMDSDPDSSDEEDEEDDDENDEGRRLDEETRRARAQRERRRRLDEEAAREREEAAVAAREAQETRAAVTRYEARWAVLQAGVSEAEAARGGLGFADVPWPVVGRPAAPGEIETAGIEAFVLAGGLPGDRARDRVKGAMMRWHPDRFGRLWGRVREEERAEIEEGVGLVARCLSELMEKYAQ